MSRGLHHELKRLREELTEVTHEEQLILAQHECGLLLEALQQRAPKMSPVTKTMCPGTYWRSKKRRNCVRVNCPYWGPASPIKLKICNGCFKSMGRDNKNNKTQTKEHCEGL